MPNKDIMWQSVNIHKITKISCKRLKDIKWPANKWDVSHYIMTIKIELAKSILETWIYRVTLSVKSRGWKYTSLCFKQTFYYWIRRTIVNVIWNSFNNSLSLLWIFGWHFFPYMGRVFNESPLLFLVSVFTRSHVKMDWWNHGNVGLSQEEPCAPTE